MLLFFIYNIFRDKSQSNKYSFLLLFFFVLFLPKCPIIFKNSRLVALCIPFSNLTGFWCYEWEHKNLIKLHCISSNKAKKKKQNFSSFPCFKVSSISLSWHCKYAFQVRLTVHHNWMWIQIPSQTCVNLLYILSPAYNTSFMFCCLHFTHTSAAGESSTHVSVGQS